MEMRGLTKRSMKIFLVVAMLAICFVCITGTSIHAETDMQRQEVKAVLEQYFEELYATLLEDSDVDYSADEFAGINGYIIAKQMVALRYSYNTLSGGIHKVDLGEVRIEDLSSHGNQMDVVAYVNFTFYFGDDEDCRGGALYRVKLARSGERYRVIDLDNDGEITRLAKDSILNVPAAVSESGSFRMVDSFFQQMQRNTDSMLETNIEIPRVEETEFAEAEEYSTASTFVPFNIQKARDYAYTYGNLAENYIFKRASADCTNFVSQCVWAGYGGADGYTLPTNPSLTNATCIALKERVRTDYRMVTGQWYGRNYDSNYDPPAKFCNVESFYNYVTSNTGDGPKATGYNDGQLYTQLSIPIIKGDVLQFYNSSTGRYSHSVMVVSTGTHYISDCANIRVAQHSTDYSERPLQVLINGFDGDSCKMRLLRFRSTTF